jgi:hypothetical protein
MIEKDSLTTILKEQRDLFLKKEVGIKRTLLEEVKKVLQTPQIATKEYFFFVNLSK